MTDGPKLKPPGSCTASEREAFARAVLRGFPRAKRLQERIGAARCLGLHFVGEELAGVAALKSPAEAVRDDLFRSAGVNARASEYPIDLGWVYVAPAHRGKGIGRGLCRALLELVPGARVYSTTRTDNRPMSRILEGLGFARVGHPYPRRDEWLVVYLRPR